MNDDTRSLEQGVFARAEEEGVNPAVVALLNYNLPIHGPQWWCDPVPMHDGADVYTEGVDLIGCTDNVLTRYAEALAESVQFPLQTAYLHGIGVVASAMSHNHSYAYYGQEKPVTLYVVTAQPPSSGKSAINGYLTGPVREAVRARNDENRAAQLAIQQKIADAQARLKKAKTDSERQSTAEDIAGYEQQLADVAPYRYGITDATPEALEDMAGKQKGVFSVVSDEADAINVILGSVYGDKKANMGLFLSGWDSDYFSSARITRGGYEGRVSGCISVIAQDESIDSILTAGLSGRGVSERFLMLRERRMLGHRDHTSYTQIDKALSAAYHDTIARIFSAEPTTFCPCERGVEFIRELKVELEPKMAESGEYSNNFLCGVVGKAEKQVMKIASVLHALNEYESPSGIISKQIHVDRIAEAAMVFNQCLLTYKAAADSKGYVGSTTEIVKLVDFFTKKAEKKKLKITMRQLRDGIKNTKPFDGQPNLSKHIRETALPALVEMGYIVVDNRDDVIHINPRLK